MFSVEMLAKVYLHFVTEILVIIRVTKLISDCLNTEILNRYRTCKYNQKPSIIKVLLFYIF